LKTLFSRHELITLVFPGHCLACEAELPHRSEHSGHSVRSHRPKTDSQTDSQTHEPTNHRAASFFQWQHAHWCLDCWQRLTNRPQNSCQKCGAYLARPNPFGDRCALCYGQDLRFDAALATGNYQNLLQELIIQMKNSHDETIAHQLGVLLGYELLNAGWGDFDHIVSVPAHWWRKLKRGFLAAEIIAESVSRITGMTNSPHTIRGVRRTKKQGTLSTQARIANVRGAFEILPKANVKDARILVIDDVMTSGATASEIARILKKSGAAAVSIAVVARGARVS
jgi:ComF family protein